MEISAQIRKDVTNGQENVLEIRVGNKLLARILVFEELLDIYPVENINKLGIQIRGNGFDYSSF